MQTSISQDLNYLAESIYKVLENDSLQKLTVYRWGRMTTKAYQEFPAIIKRNLNEEDFLKLDNAEQVIQLKRIVSQVWPSLSKEENQVALLGWIVKKWGKIWKIKEETLRTYAHNICRSDQEVEKFLEPKDRISSKSKCLAFIHPESYFIYDSRVAMALDLIIREWHPNFEWEFMIPSGASNDYKRFVKKSERNPIAHYSHYRRLIEMVGQKCGCQRADLQRIEMKLFMLGRNLEEFRNCLHAMRHCGSVNA